MDGSIVQTYLGDVLHAVSQALLAPDIVLLLAFIAYALFCIGSIVAERFSERRHFTIVMPKFLAALMAANEDEIPAVITESGLLHRQKVALLTVYDYRMLPGDALLALIRRLVNEEETRYDRITGRNNMAARVAPMLGLMGTLIPLGPGIQALGNADTAALSSSLLVAFDTTVAGLVAAAVCLVVGKIRSNWYGNYMSALDAAMATMLQKIEDMRAEGKIVIKEPTDYAFLFESESAKRSSKAAEDAANAAQDVQAGVQAGAKGKQGPANEVSAYPAQSAQPAASAQPAQTAQAAQATQSQQPFASSQQTAHPFGAPASDSAKPSVQPFATQMNSAAATGPIFASNPSQGAISTSFSSPSASAQGPQFATPRTNAQGTSSLVGSLPEISGNGSAGASAAGGAQTPSMAGGAQGAGVSRIVPPVEDVPMPAFIDALAAAGVPPVGDPAQQAPGQATGPMNIPTVESAPTSGHWFKASASEGAAPAGTWPQTSQAQQSSQSQQVQQSQQPQPGRGGNSSL